MILRIIYDDEGKGMEHEPAGLSQIQSHMDQLGSIIYKYAAHIYTTQGLFIGSWGEMHTSKFCDRQSLCRLIDSFYHATKALSPWQCARPHSCAVLKRDCLNIRIPAHADGFFPDRTV